MNTLDQIENHHKQTQSQLAVRIAELELNKEEIEKELQTIKAQFRDTTAVINTCLKAKEMDKELPTGDKPPGNE